MTKDEFKSRTTIASVLEERGIRVPQGRQVSVRCPLHEDGNPSFSINTDEQIWHCHAGCGGGDVITLLAKLEGTTDAEILKRYTEMENNGQRNGNHRPAQRAPEPRAEIDTIYSYVDENGAEAFQAVRLRPKSFRQRHQRNGEWVWNLEGVRRVLYRLPEVLSAEQVWLVEGEKDVDNMRALGFRATCNPMGAGKWLDSYSEFLRDKDVILCGDNDDPGRVHMEKVAVSLASFARTTRRVKLPDHLKDVSDFIATLDPDAAQAALNAMVASAQVLIRGVHVPVKAMWEMEDSYIGHITNIDQEQFDLTRWIPSLRNVRPLVLGDVVTIIGSTGVGKTALLQNIAVHAGPLPTLFFEMELPEELLYERFLGIQNHWTAQRVEETYRAGILVGDRMGRERMTHLRHVFVCPEPRLTMEAFERIIETSELKIGQRPKIVLLDYIQLATGKGSSRYERASDVAEGLKVIAKKCRVILIVASQISRKDPKEPPDVSLSDAKDSGSIENSSGLVLGAWRDVEDAGLVHLKVLKNTKGPCGFTVRCRFLEDMRIGEEGTTTTDVPLPRERQTSFYANPPYADA